jgi:hypothetical protein
VTRYTVETTAHPRRTLRTFTGGHPGLREAEQYAADAAAERGVQVQVVDVVTQRVLRTVPRGVVL